MVNQTVANFLCVCGLITLFLTFRIHKVLLVAVILAWMRTVVNAAVATAIGDDQRTYLLTTLAIEYLKLLFQTLRALPRDQWMGIIRDMLISGLWLEDDHPAVPLDRFSQNNRLVVSALSTSQC